MLQNTTLEAVIVRLKSSLKSEMVYLCWDNNSFNVARWNSCIVFRKQSINMLFAVYESTTSR